MSTYSEVGFGPTVVVYNEESGIREGKRIATEFHRLWPRAVGLISLLELLDNPKKYKGKNLIACGGDGTLASVANVVARNGKNTWCLTIPTGTMNQIPDALGIQPEPSENTPEFIGRLIVEAWKTQIVAGEYEAGTVKGNDFSKSYLWSAGSGFMSKGGLGAIEKTRNKYLPKVPRMAVALRGMADNYSSRLIYEMEVSGQNPIPVMDVEVVKADFGTFGGLKLPKELGQEDKLMYVEPPQKGGYYRHLMAMAIDGLCMYNGLPPIMERIKVVGITGKTVVIRGDIRQIHVDSELKEWNGEEVIINTVEKNNPHYTLLASIKND